MTAYFQIFTFSPLTLMFESDSALYRLPEVPHVHYPETISPQNVCIHN